MKKIYALLFLTLFFSSKAQHKRNAWASRNLNNKWAWSANTSVFAFSNIKSHSSAGFDAEWYFNENWSLRGGVSAGTDYLKITTEPFTLWLISRGGDSHHHHYNGNRWTAQGAKVLFMLLINSDALCYNIPLNKQLYVSVFASPLQTMFTFSDNKMHAYSLIGGGIKYISKYGLTVNANMEYDRSFLFETSDQGFKLNFSLGYLLK